MGGFNIASSTLPHLTSSGSGLLGLFGKTGVALGASTTTGAVLTGAGSIAGGATMAAGAGHILKSGYDSYKAFNAGDKTTGKAELARAGATAGGMAVGVAGGIAGAKIGAAIGSFIPIPVLGTAAGALIGGGIGTAIGWFAGDKIAKNIEAAAYEAEGLKEEYKDAKTEEEKLAVYSEALYNNAKRHFGEISLSMSEISRIADQIVWGDDITFFEQFSAATKTAEESLKTLNNATEQANKWMWKAGLKVKFDEDEKESFAASFSDYIESAKAYVENRHYEFTTSASLLLDLGSEEGKSFIEGGNAYYAKITEDLDAAGKELGDALAEALADGIIEAPEEEAIIAAQQKIAEITEKIANAEMAAEIELIKVKWGDGNIDYESFQNLMGEMETTLNERITASEEAFTVQVANLSLRFPEGGAEYDAALQTLIDGYVASVDNVRAEVVGVELDILGDAYSKELGNDAAQKLRNVLEYSINNNVNPVMIDDSTLANLLLIDPNNLTGVTANNIKNMLSSVISHAGGLVSQQTFTVSPVVNISPRIGHVNKIDSTKFNLMRFRGGFVGGGSSAIEGFADGGFVRGGARLVTVAEEGTPEVIIPLGSHRRARGLELWKKAGEMLGIKNYGRIMSGSGDQGIRNHAYSGGTGEISNTAQVNLGGVSVSIQVDASGSENVAEVIKAQSGEIAETVATMLAAELGAQFENTPAKGGVA